MYIYMSLPFFGGMRVRLWYLTVCGSSIALHKYGVCAPWMQPLLLVVILNAESTGFALGKGMF